VSAKGTDLRIYSLKPEHLSALTHHFSKKDNTMSERTHPDNNNDHRFIVSGRATEAIYEIMKKYAHYADTILLIGETGVGKDLVARELHRIGRRSDQPYIPVPLTALSETLLESELFGHEKGAFTGADRDKTGIFEAADGGVLYFPEISELPKQVQIKLLHFIQYRTFRRVGHHHKKPEIQVDVCLIFATNEHPEDCVRRKKIRSDFYYRINKHQIFIPPIRNRRDEIALLARHFVCLHARLMFEKDIDISPAAIELLRGYDWPGNVRELEHIVQQILIDFSGDFLNGKTESRIFEDHVSLTLYPNGSSLKGFSKNDDPHPINWLFSDNIDLPVYNEVKTEMKRLYFSRLLEQTGNNLKKAAAKAGITERGLRKIMKEIGVNGNVHR
jgi:DNA-binding NtrC family response regulator